MTAYTDHLKSYAAKNKISYKEAMSNAGAKTAYAKIKAELPVKEKKPRTKKVKEEVAEDTTVEPKPKKVVRRKVKPKDSDEPQIFQSD